MSRTHLPPPAPSAERRLAPRELRGLVLRQVLPVGLVIGLILILREEAQALDLAGIAHALTRITAPQWLLALVATLGSFWAIGRYDGVLHRQLATGIAQGPARRAGVLAIAISQAVGLGTLTGALVRWRMIPGMTIWQALRLSAAISMSFLAGWAVVAAGAVLLFQPPLVWGRTLVAIALLGCALTIALALWPPRRLARFPMPALRALAAIVGLAAADCCLAGLALWALVPPDLAVPPTLLLLAFLFAMGAGLLGGTPGGIGPFEVTLLALLPQYPAEPLLAAALGFRIVYHVVPALLAAPFVVLGARHGIAEPGARLTRMGGSPFLSPKLEVQLFAAPRAEVNLLRQGEFALLTAPGGGHVGLAAPIGQSLVMLSDPMTRGGLSAAAAHEALRMAARDRYLMPAIYKCGARMAAMARARGWAVLPVAREAWLTPAAFIPDGPGRRQLRRALRKAADAGVRVSEAGRHLPMDAMNAVAAEWSQARGGERGFSMGRFDPDYVTCQRVFLAWHADRLVGFITLHETRSEMTLDLMRSRADAPEGTMQALVSAAIEAAAAWGCPRLSLAAVPWEGRDALIWVARLRARMSARSGAAGLTRFKASFDPNWETLYAAAPSRIGLALAGLGILRRITAPQPRSTDNPMRVVAGLRAAGSAMGRRASRYGRRRG